MDDPALRRLDNWDTLGMRSTNSHDLEFNDLFVPDEHVVFLTPEAQFPRESFGQNYFRFGLITFGALYLGIAEAAWTYLKRVLRDRWVPGEIQPIIEIPGLYNAVGAIDMKLREATAMLNWTVHEHADPLRWDATTLPAIAAMKDAVTRDSVAIVEMCMQALGGASYYKRVPLERLYRDVRAGPIHPFNHPAAVAMLGRMLAS
jgi:alkylation response protein AidB-like acyl-CoA dehydrogenase